MKITLSKSQWEQIGQKAGWMRMAATWRPDPLANETEEQLTRRISEIISGMLVSFSYKFKSADVKISLLKDTIWADIIIKLALKDSILENRILAAKKLMESETINVLLANMKNISKKQKAVINIVNPKNIEMRKTLG